MSLHTTSFTRGGRTTRDFTQIRWSMIVPRHGSTGTTSMFQPPDSTASEVDKIYRAHAGFVWRVARARGIPLVSIPDVLQEIFVTVLRRLSTYHEVGSLKGWLYTIADGHIRQFFRTEGRRQRRLTLFKREASGHSAGDEMDEHLKRSEASQLVQQFIDQLPDDAREVFLLCCVEGLPGVEVARLLNLNINTLYTREAAARRRFQAFVLHTRTAKELTP
jgi:RNA polymerase sigma-70 factor (ECF subfamily)